MLAQFTFRTTDSTADGTTDLALQQHVPPNKAAAQQLQQAT